MIFPTFFWCYKKHTIVGDIPITLWIGGWCQKMDLFQLVYKNIPHKISTQRIPTCHLGMILMTHWNGNLWGFFWMASKPRTKLRPGTSPVGELGHASSCHGGGDDTWSINNNDVSKCDINNKNDINNGDINHNDGGDVWWMKPRCIQIA